MNIIALHRMHIYFYFLHTELPRMGFSLVGNDSVGVCCEVGNIVNKNVPREPVTEWNKPVVCRIG